MLWITCSPQEAPHEIYSVSIIHFFTVYKDRHTNLSPLRLVVACLILPSYELEKSECECWLLCLRSQTSGEHELHCFNSSVSTLFLPLQTWQCILGPFLWCMLLCLMLDTQFCSCLLSVLIKQFMQWVLFKNQRLTGKSDVNLFYSDAFGNNVLSSLHLTMHRHLKDS